MLSPNTLLNKARYCVDGLVRRAAAWTIYSATDRTSGNRVLVIEREPGFTGGGDENAHDGLMSFSDAFEMNGRRYSVTEPVGAPTVEAGVKPTFERFSVILMALNSLSVARPGLVEVSPEMVVACSDGRFKLLPLEMQSTGLAVDAWHLPIEAVWDDLDHISQKAIFNAWDESDISLVETPRDEASNIYSLAAVFYKILTGGPPPGGFERAVVELDGADPIVPPASLNKALPREASDFLMRCLQLRRKDRLSSYEAAILALPTLDAEDEASDPLELELTRPKPVSTHVVSERAVIGRVDVVQKFAPAKDGFRQPVPEWHAPEAPGSDEPTPSASREAEPDLLPNLNTAEPVTERHLPTVDTDMPAFLADPKPQRGFGMKLAVAAIVLACLGGTGWAVLQYSGSAAPPPSVSQPASASLTSQLPVAVPEATTSNIAAPTETPRLTVDETDAATASNTGRPQTAQVRTPAKTTPKATPSEPQKAKKKVTVDDLINDN